MKRLFFFAAMCLMALSMSAQDYVDLGLPSGTLWKNVNEQGFYTYDDAMAKFGNYLPTKDQFEELINSCEWTWTGNGYKIVGPSGKSISLPAAGVRLCSTLERYVGEYGYYWSSSPDAPLSQKGAMEMYFSPNAAYVYPNARCNGLSIRLVSK